MSNYKNPGLWVEYEEPLGPDDFSDGEEFFDAETMTIVHYPVFPMDPDKMSEEEYLHAEYWAEHCAGIADAGNAFRFTPGGMISALRRHEELQDRLPF